MKNVKDLSNDQIFNWLKKTSASCSSYARKNSIGSQRSYDLIDRYNELREEAKERSIWRDYCDSIGFDYNHDACDFWA